MKKIDKIDELHPKYISRLLGVQTKISDTPFVITAGTLTDSGEIVNGAPDVVSMEIPQISIPHTTTDIVVLSFRNTRHRKLTLSLIASTNPTSFDYKVKFLPDLPRGSIATSALLRDSVGGNLWQKNAVAGTPHNIYYGELPMGNGLFEIRIDNNDGANPLIISGAIQLSDPIR